MSVNLVAFDLINRADPKFNTFNQKWELITDSVMGGLSTGVLEPLEENGRLYYKLSGIVNTKNNGGFIQFRSKVEFDDDDYTGIEIEYRSKGDYEKYNIHITTRYTILPWQYYEAKLPNNDSWCFIKIPLSSFKKSHFYQPNSFSPRNIKTIGFSAIGGDFYAELDIKNIKLYK